MKYKDLKNITDAEAVKMLDELRAKRHELSVKLKLNQLKNTSEVRLARKDIARILTFLHSKNQ